jgi:transposase
MERKVKYNYEFKLQCINEVLKKHSSISHVKSKYCIQESLLKKWLIYYKKYGKESLKPRPKRTQYEGDFKLKVVLSVKNKYLSLAGACLKYNMPSVSTLMNWVNKYDTFGASVLYKQTLGRPMNKDFKRVKKKSDKPLTREEELLKENEALRCENALLKKFNALIQEKKLQQPKKPKL